MTPEIYPKVQDTMLVRALGLWLLILCTQTLANTAIVVDSPNYRESIARHIEVLEDETGKLTIEKLVKHQTHRAFYNLNTNNFNFGHTYSAYWFRIPIANNSAHELQLTLEVNFPLLDNIQFFTSNENGSFTKLQLGDTMFFTERSVDSRNFLINFHMKRNEEKVYYLRVQSKGTLFLPIYLSAGSNLTQHIYKQELIIGCFYGLMLGFLAYNLFLQVATKEKIYFWYTLMAVSAAYGIATLDGIMFQLLPSFIWLQQIGIYLSCFIALLASYQFTRHYLAIIDDHIPLDKLLQYGSYLMGSFLVLTPILPIPLIAPLTSFSLFISALIFLCCGIMRWYQGFRPAIYFNIAWSLSVVTSLLLSFSAQGLFNFSDLGNNLLKLGITLSIISLSLGLIDKISRMREEQYQLKKAELDAVTESQAKSNFMAKMSHEIRTPMNGVLGITRLLMESGLSPTQTRYTNIIFNSGRSLLHIIDDILDHSKIEAGKMNLENIPFDLLGLVDDCMSIFTLKCHEDNLVFFSSITSESSTLLVGDANRLKQVLVNLLSNASKFTHEGEVSLYVTKVGESEDDVTLNFSVHDTGIGISSEIQHKLFLSFQQEDNSTSRLYGGSGLGLTISKELVDLMGGELEFSSTKGQGSTFYFSIKLKKQSDAQITTEPLEPKGSLLFAVPSMSYSEALADQISAFGYTSDFVLNGQDLNEQLRILKVSHNTYDFLLIDTNLDGINEIDTSLITNLGKQAKIIGLLPLNKEIKDCEFSFPISSYIEKPTSAFQLSRELESLETDTKGKEALSKEEESVSRTFAHVNILVAEDNKVNQTVIKGMLKKLGISSEIVDNGQLAFDQYTNSDLRYDIVLMDCEMPILDGYAASSKIRDFEDKHNLPHVPIIALTAHVLPEHKANSQKSGMNDHISKPVDIATLKEKLITYLA